jgi:hypothetical protein
MNKIDTNFRILSHESNGRYQGATTWVSSNAKIVQIHAGGDRQGYEGKYMVYCGGKLVKEIPFSYTSSLKEELEKINLDGE